MITGKPSKHSIISFRSYSAMLFLVLPMIYLLGIIVYDIHNWGSILYAEFIKSITRAESFYWVDDYYPLGYPAILKGLFFFFNDYLLAGKILSAASSVIVAYFAAKIAATIHTERAGFLGQLLLLSSSPLFFSLSVSEGTDMTAVAPLFISLYLLLKDNNGNSKPIFISGLFMGFVYLIRYPGLLFMIMSILWLLLHSRDIKNNLKLSMIYIAGFLSTSAFQLVPSALKTGNPFYNNAMQNIYFSDIITLWDSLSKIRIPKNNLSKVN